MAHVFVNPKNIDAESAENIHIFRATKTNDDKYRIQSTAYCGNVNRKSNTPFEARDSDKGARDHAASLENSNNTVCGQCVAHLYSDGK